jgi:hypothetical protein
MEAKGGGQRPEVGSLSIEIGQILPERVFVCSMCAA